MIQIPSNNYFFKLITFICATLLLNGCSRDISDLNQFIAQTKTKHKGFVQPLPPFEPYQSFIYDATDLRDPFVPEVETEVAGDAAGISPDTQRRKEPLEFFPMDSLKMVGTLQRDNNLWGLVRAPDGTIHRVLKGNHMGQNFGEVLSVNETEIAVQEIVKDGVGDWIERQSKLSLGDE